MISPGIWKQEGNKIVCGKGYAIATVNSHATTEGKANGAVLSSSAKLLDALKTLRSAVVLGGGLDDAIQFAEQAIREAEGKA